MTKYSVLKWPDINSAFLARSRPRISCSNENRNELHMKQSMWKDDLFAIHFPYLMKSQWERIQREKEIERLCYSGSTVTSAQRKRKRKENRKKLLPHDEEQNVALIMSTLETVVERVKSMGILLKDACATHLSDNNNCATAAANAPGCGTLFHLACEETANPDFTYHPDLILDGGKTVNLMKVSDILGRHVKNVSDAPSIILLDEHKFVIPARSSFLTSTFHHLVSLGYSYLMVEPGYDLVVIDPPWRNKSVKRKKSYHTLTEADLTYIPLDQLCADGALVCVWVTNNLKMLEFVKDTLLPAWSVHYLATWMWVKVTTCGEPVCDLHSEHKKPYEQLIFGRFKGKTYQDPCHSNLESEDFEQKNISTNGNHNTMKNYSRSNVEKVDNACSSDASLNESISPVVFDGEQNNLNLDSNGEGSANPAVKISDQLNQCLPEVPDKFMLVSVPCALHSKKPLLIDALQPFLPPKPQCLELFARNLVPGWTSWGDEPLCHQHVDYMEPSSLPD